MILYNSLNLFFINIFTILVPRFFHSYVARFWGRLFYLILPQTRRSIRANLQVITGQAAVDELVRSTLYMFARNWCDNMLIMRLRGPQLFSLIARHTGDKPLDDALAAGKGAILISPHLGNWELGGLGLAEKGYPMNVLTLREPDEKVNRMREKLRRERGINFIYVDRDDTSPLAIIEAVNALRRNEVLAILGDRDGSSHTMRMEFFGRPTDIPVGAAYLALASGAPVIPVFVPLEGERYATIMEEPIHFRVGQSHNRSIQEGITKVVQVFERYIRKYPDQWYNLFDYWAAEKLEREKRRQHV